MTTTTTTTTLEATFVKSIWSKPDNPWGVGTFQDADRKQHKVAGNIGHCIIGKTYTLAGREESTRYGTTFKVVSVVAIEPKSGDAVEAYLETLPGIGSVTARAIVKTYGPENAIAALERDDLQAIREKTGARLSAEQLAEIRLCIDAERSSRETDLQIRKLLGDLATDKLVEKIIAEWGDQAPGTIAKNPWILTDLERIGFLRADACALRIGAGKESPERIRACVLHVIGEMRNDGHTKFFSDLVISEACEMLKIGSKPVMDTIGAMIYEDSPPKLVEIEACAWLQLVADHRVETEIAAMLAARLARQAAKAEQFKELEQPPGLFKDQVEALNKMVAAGPCGTCLLTGAPGTGKTTMVRSFFGWFDEWDVALCAPTGKAAKRLSQQAKMEATTIHRFLEPQVTTTKKGPVFGFARGKDNQVDKRLVVVDEASMVDARLFRDLLAAIPLDCYLLIVGDPNQLPSVSPGSVLRDLIESGKIPHAQLTQIKRANPGAMLTSIHAVKDGRWNKITNEPGSDLFLVPVQTDNECVATMADLYLDRLPKLLQSIAGVDGLGEPVKVDAVQDVQLLIPWRSKEGLSARTVNMEIQRRRAALGLVALGGKWQLGVGDKVIQQKNDYTLGIVNGDQGVIVGMSQVEDPTTGAERWCYEVSFAGYDAPIMVPAIGCDMELSYAVTIHKSQGSEWPIIVVPAMQTNSPFFDRTLLYTAMSRASKALVVVGNQHGLQAVVDRISAERRRTNLVAAMSTTSKQR